MLLDVSRALKSPGQSFPLQGTLTLNAMEVLNDKIQFEDIELKGTFVGTVESVKVTAHIVARVKTRCSLCLGSVDQPIETDMEEVFARVPDPDSPDDHPLVGYKIDLTEPVRDALLLELPIQFSCKKDCLGLCPVCGVNRNEQLCTCQEGGKRLNPFSALSELLIEDEEV